MCLLCNLTINLLRAGNDLLDSLILTPCIYKHSCELHLYLWKSLLTLSNLIWVITKKVLPTLKLDSSIFVYSILRFPKVNNYVNYLMYCVNRLLDTKNRYSIRESTVWRLKLNTLVCHILNSHLGKKVYFSTIISYIASSIYVLESLITGMYLCCFLL